MVETTWETARKALVGAAVPSQEKLEAILLAISVGEQAEKDLAAARAVVAGMREAVLEAELRPPEGGYVELVRGKVCAMSPDRVKGFFEALDARWKSPDVVRWSNEFRDARSDAEQLRAQLAEARAEVERSREEARQRGTERDQVRARLGAAQDQLSERTRAIESIAADCELKGSAPNLSGSPEEADQRAIYADIGRQLRAALRSPAAPKEVMPSDPASPGATVTPGGSASAAAEPPSAQAIYNAMTRGTALDPVAAWHRAAERQATPPSPAGPGAADPVRRALAAYMTATSGDDFARAHRLALEAMPIQEAHDAAPAPEPGAPGLSEEPAPFSEALLDAIMASGQAVACTEPTHPLASLPALVYAYRRLRASGSAREEFAALVEGWRSEAGAESSPWYAAIRRCADRLQRVLDGAREGQGAEVAPCGGTRCFRSPETGNWIHSSKSYSTCSVHPWDDPAGAGKDGGK